MNPDRWSDLVGRLKDDDKIISQQTEELDGRPGTVERIVVSTPMGKMRLSYTTEPKRVSEKALYSKRGGSTANIQVEYDESDIIHVFTVEKEQSGEWVEVDPAMFAK